MGNPLWTDTPVKTLPCLQMIKMYIWPSVNIYMQKLLGDFLPPATKLGQGNIFRSVCQEFCPQGGGVWADPPPSRYPREQCMLGDTGNKRAVRILLECRLVRSNILWFYIWWFRETPDSFLAMTGTIPVEWKNVHRPWMGDWQPECSSDTVLAASILVNSGICTDWLSRKNFPHKNEKHLVREIRLLCVPPSPNLPMQSVKSQCWQIQYFSRWEH